MTLPGTPRAIAPEFAKYLQLYQSWATNEREDLEVFVGYLPIPQLDPDQVEALEEKISEGEVTARISQLNNFPNGFPIQFYKWVTLKVVKPILFSAASEAGILPPDLREATIALINKEGKGADNCAS
ncbi:hypothetical protein NDU88_004635 [Pleurodeles waltl]|uniref:Uncharacterized protein n=1 Tax=Pleurodeles waltl TaxID=8319 RepID=A0AAV7UFN4_PLEWA|nr:hypothetical protein NDU88_004635 [Pleurodeles waltl]